MKVSRWAAVSLAALLASCSAGPRGEPAPAAVVLVLDASGSMAGKTFDSLKEACLAATKEVGSDSFIGILAFNAEPRWAVCDAAQAIGALKAEGPSLLLRALQEARRGLQALVPAGARKRVLLVSGGDTTHGDFESLLGEMRTEGSSVTAVCVGSAPNFDAALMSQIADWGSGRFIFTHGFKNVPKLVAHETRHMLLP
jgi:Ca-activated chloride channel homolog